MVAKLIGKLSSHRRTRITLEVRETNLPAQLFFQQPGFRAVTVLRGLLRGHARGRLPDAVPPRADDDAGDAADQPHGPQGGVNANAVG